MSFALTVCDESSLGERRPALTLQLPEPRITARELIRTRVFEEVKSYNEGLALPFQGLVQPTAEERLLNGAAAAGSHGRRAIDWHQQAEVALEAFERNGFLLFVDDRQVESLTEEIAFRGETQVVFLKLLPLVGG